MREITIDENKYNISCTVYTTFLYKKEFGTKMADDYGKFMEIQSTLSKKQDELKKEKISENDRNFEIGKTYLSGLDDTIEILLQLTYIEIKTVNPNFMNYMDFVKTIKSINLSNSWISEVVKETTDCFRG